jgi:hypothetical protein
MNNTATACDRCGKEIPFSETDAPDRCADCLMAETITPQRIVYLVTLDTPNGMAQLDVPSMMGPEAAGRRAHISACAIGWGDIDEITVTSVEISDDQS